MATKPDIERLALRAKCANAVVAATNQADGATDDGTFAKIHDMANDLTIQTQTAFARALGMIGDNGDVLEGAHPDAHELWAGNAGDEIIDAHLRTAGLAPKLLGYQIADGNGANIQGDAEDPSGEPSFRILSLLEANEIMADPANRHLRLAPVYEGDIQDPVLPR